MLLTAWRIECHKDRKMETYLHERIPQAENYPKDQGE